MRMSHTNYKNVIEGLGGDPMRFLLLLVHTLNVFINKFASGARNFFLIFQCHTVTNGTDLRRSPQVKDLSCGESNSVAAKVFLNLSIVPKVLE